MGYPIDSYTQISSFAYIGVGLHISPSLLAHCFWYAINLKPAIPVKKFFLKRRSSRAIPEAIARDLGAFGNWGKDENCNFKNRILNWGNGEVFFCACW